MTEPHESNRPRDDRDISYEASRIEPAGRAAGEPDAAALAHLDARARAAAAGLHHHVRSHTSANPAVPLPVDARRQRRGRVLVVAAVVSLIAGFVATQDPGGRDGGRVDLDESELPDVAPGLLTPLGPRDGKDSIQLPLTAEPSTGLRDGDVITVRAEGFVAGESVGIVQCAREAGGDQPDQRAGAEACDLGAYQGATADEDGVATGTYELRRILTTPLTGTVDCAAEAERCIVAMGAISDYDRSGGTALLFDPDVDPVVLPTVAVEPATELAHGQVVRVVAEGLTPGQPVMAMVCSSDPSVCATVGQLVRMSFDEGAPDTYLEVGLPVDDAGRIDTELQVWRFLPGYDSGTYVDCAVSRCSLRLQGTLAPPTVPLTFRGDEPPPEAPALGIEPSTGLVAGQDAIVAGRGFAPGSEVWLDLCVGPADGTPQGFFYCESTGRSAQVDADGAFATVWRVPDVTRSGGFETCHPDGTCREVRAGEMSCRDGRFRCQLVANAGSPQVTDAGAVGQPAPPPTFAAVPLPVTFGP